MLRSSQVTRLVGISLRQLYYWELKGIVRPRHYRKGSRQFKRYIPEDVERLKKLKQALNEEYTLGATARKAASPSSVILSEGC